MWWLARHQLGFAAQVSLDNRGDIDNAHSINMEATGRTTALNEGHDYILVCLAAFAFRHSLKAADKSFVGLNDRAFAAHRY